MNTPKSNRDENGWIGVDFDGTLSQYHKWERWDKLGDPVIRMVERVKNWLDEGYEVRIVTARVGHGAEFKCLHTGENVTKEMMISTIQDWTEKHIGVRLPVTNEKDYKMIELWDDRAVQVETNTGKLIGRSIRGL